MNSWTETRVLVNLSNRLINVTLTGNSESRDTKEK